ncbi:MAG: hypothetical protein IPP27_04475 [Bacteroidetes bacterium]|nr:hypothetical protein [Bacteroidota bacterium]MBK8364009.1 hypothetical protein [Bacteroidota bacterium]MBK9415022.1 hypothetical protein [Bacteroidota bacterium]MBL0031454.1 hypothetical protein [Bacteroidota bacterium]MBP6533067.1 hypothetical protein [Bacteroidia bacterium]
MNKTRRFAIIFVSVGVGSLISIYLIQKRMGTLSKQDYINLGFNFFFSVAMVVGVSILLQRMNNKYDKEQGKKNE